jgi:hypothetical protein
VSKAGRLHVCRREQRFRTVVRGITGKVVRRGFATVIAWRRATQVRNSAANLRVKRHLAQAISAGASPIAPFRGGLGGGLDRVNFRIESRKIGGYVSFLEIIPRRTPWAADYPRWWAGPAVSLWAGAGCELVTRSLALRKTSFETNHDHENP